MFLNLYNNEHSFRRHFHYTAEWSMPFSISRKADTLTLAPTVQLL